MIYVSFGTVLGHMVNAVDVYRAALRAVEGLEVRVLMTVGRRFDPSALEPIPRHVHVEAWIDQNRVLGHAEAVVTHCGSGTALGALAAGVPIVAVPLFADQFENSSAGAAACSNDAGITTSAHGPSSRSKMLQNSRRRSRQCEVIPLTSATPA